MTMFDVHIHIPCMQNHIKPFPKNKNNNKSQFFIFIFFYLHRNKQRNYRRRFITERSRRVLPHLEHHRHLLHLCGAYVLWLHLLRLHLHRKRRRRRQRRKQGDRHVPLDLAVYLQR
ncbi:hypothetical protein TanjilG_01731 [Lupinus angustifolius]|nr:hypothetical protein TanjilG_01731 [Lupinus angustifolius]